MQETQDKILEEVTSGDYKYGFVTRRSSPYLG